ncbi:MAG: hypothetical protein LUC97_09470 [Clostridiales bacterium]|nr:hypothetical protein [Clostridiales bacterium]
MYDEIVERLISLGCSYDSENDDTLLYEEMERGKEFVLSSCNLSSIPSEIEGAYIDIVCGYFLRSKLYGGALSGENGEGIVSRITEGDVTVEYAADKEVSTYERVDGLVSRLLDKETELTSVRKIKW